MSDRPNQSDPVKLIGSIHLLSLDSGARALLDFAVGGAEKGFHSTYACSLESSKKDPADPEGKERVRGVVIVLAGVIPESDLEGLQDYLGGMAQDVILTGKDRVIIADMPRSRKTEEPPTEAPEA